MHKIHELWIHHITVGMIREGDTLMQVHFKIQ